MTMIPLTIVELVWQIFINYPPTLEQLKIGILNPPTLWAVRLVSLALIILTTFFISRLITEKTRKYFWIIVFACPALSLLWMSYPLDIVKLFIIFGGFFFLIKKRKSYLVATIIVTVVLLILNLFVFKQNPKIIETLSPTRSQAEVIHRFTIEDSLTPHVQIPTIIRRVGYNKYFVMIKNSANEALTFFDLESLFFQDFHPLGQKSFAIFFWPGIFILSISIWQISQKRQKVPKIFLSLLFISFIYFLTTSASTERRLIMLIFPLAIIVSESVSLLLAKTNKGMRKIIFLLIFLSLYGWITNYYDRFVRPDFWLDNRPIVYDTFLSYLKDNNMSYGQILVPDTLYSTKDYCPYYLKNCDMFEFENFDLTKQDPKVNTLYVGFTGNFLGLESKDFSSSEIKGILEGRGFVVLKTKHILNNIASGYGQELIMAKIKE